MRAIASLGWRGLIMRTNLAARTGLSDLHAFVSRIVWSREIRRPED